jgi:hypothetical protein
MDFDLSQPATGQQDPLGGNVDVTSPEYQKAMVNRYALSTQPGYVQSQRDLASGLAARGMNESGAAAAGEANLAQSRAAGIGQEASQVGQQQSGQSFEKQQAATAQNYAMARLQQEQTNAMELQKAQEAFQQHQSTMQDVGAIGSGLGSIAGTYIGAAPAEALSQQLMKMYGAQPGQGVPGSQGTPDINANQELAAQYGMAPSSALPNANNYFALPQGY